MMSRQYQITGLGPKALDGSIKLFTVLAYPFIGSAAWLAEQHKYPDVGDMLEIAEDGTMTLLSESQPGSIGGPQHEEEDVQKKSPSEANGGNGDGELCHFSSYVAKPVIVHASQITAVDEPEVDGQRLITLAGGGVKIAAPGMMARMIPTVGDYWVIVPQDGGNYEYLNPKAVFEAKYSLIEQ